MRGLERWLRLAMSKRRSLPSENGSWYKRGVATPSTASVDALTALSRQTFRSLAAGR